MKKKERQYFTYIILALIIFIAVVLTTLSMAWVKFDDTNSIGGKASSADFFSSSSENTIVEKPPIGTKTLLFIPFSFACDVSEPFTIDEIKIQLDKMVDYYREASFSQLDIKYKISTTATGNWHTIDVSDCNAAKWGAKANQQAASVGDDPNAYDLVWYLWPERGPGSDCPWSGIEAFGAYGGKNSYFNGVNKLPLYAHWFAHNFNASESNARDCGYMMFDAPGRCADDSSNPLNPMLIHADLHDVTGVDVNMNHLNAAHKNLFTWLKPPQVLDITASGTYPIRRLEDCIGQPCSPQTHVLRIPRKVVSPLKENYMEYIYIEYREPFGYDANIPAVSKNTEGILFHAWRENPDLEPSEIEYPTYLLDATPASGVKPIDPLDIKDFEDARLPVGGSVCLEPDELNKGTQITLESINTLSNTATLRVNIGPCKNCLPNHACAICGAKTTPCAPIAAESQLTFNNINEFPDTFGNYIVWTEWDPILTTSKIMLYNTSDKTLKEISNPLVVTLRLRPRVSGDFVIWEEPSMPDKLMLYKISTSLHIKIPIDPTTSKRVVPQVAGANWIAWFEQETSGLYVLQLYDLKLMGGNSTNPIIFTSDFITVRYIDPNKTPLNPGAQPELALSSGGKAVWTDFYYGPALPAIFLYNGQVSEIAPSPSGPPNIGRQQPDIHLNAVVWSEGVNRQVMSFDLNDPAKAPKTITSAEVLPGYQHLTIDRNIISWVQKGHICSPTTSIKMYNIMTDKIGSVADILDDGTAASATIAIENKNIVHSMGSDKSTQKEIFLDEVYPVCQK